VQQSILLWGLPPTELPALKQTAHVWCTALEFPPDVLQTFFSLLSSDEKARAQQFRFEKDRDHFIAARGLLRKILSRYLNIEPQNLKFQYNLYGKPSLVDHSHLQFNLSHSNGLALYAFTLDNSIGVDIEFKGRECDIDAIAQRYYSPREYEILNKLSDTEKTDAFFNGWARKEAFLKALGQGISYSLEKVEVTLTNESARFIAIHDDEQDITQWYLHALNPSLDFAAALAIKGQVDKVETWKWV